MQIEIYLKLNKTIGEIAKLLGKSTSTISREIKKYRMYVMVVNSKTDVIIIMLCICQK